MIWSTHLHCAAVALFAMAVSYAVCAWAVPSARAFSMENLEHRPGTPRGLRNQTVRPTTSAGARNPLARAAPWCSLALDKAN